MATTLVRSPSGPESECSGRFQVYEEDPEPSEINDEDLKEYARRIGINWNEEQHLLHIAVEGLRSRLPAGWKPCFDTERNQWFYFNSDSGVSQWEHPLDSHFRKAVERARRGVAGRDNSVSSSSQRDTCDDVRDIVDDASSIVVDEDNSSGDEEASPILRVDISDKDLTRNDRRSSVVSSAAKSIQEVENKGFKSVTERLLAKLSARRDSAERSLDGGFEVEEAEGRFSPRKESLGVPSASSSPKKGILKKHSGELSSALSVSEQGSNASRSVRFNFDLRPSLEVNLCPSEITEEDCSKEEEEDTSGEEESEEKTPENVQIAVPTMMKPISALGKSPLNPIGRPGSPLGPAIGSPSRKPPARLNPLAPLGKIEKKPLGSDVQPVAPVQASLKPKPLPAKTVAQPVQQKPVVKQPEPVRRAQQPVQAQQEVKKVPVGARKVGKAEEDEEEKLRRLSAIERELKEAEREKELKKAGESWERKKETLVRRKSFEMEALEKQYEVKKAVEIQRLSDEFEKQLEDEKERMKRENEEKLATLREEMKKVEEKAKEDLEDLKSKAADENAERLTALKKSSTEEYERQKNQLLAEQNTLLDQLRREQEEQLKTKRDQLSHELRKEEEKFETEKRGLEEKLRQLKDQLNSTEAELNEETKKNMERLMKAEREEFERKMGEFGRKLDEFKDKEKVWKEKEENFLAREDGLRKREAELKKRLDEVEGGVVSRMETVTHLERMLLEKEQLLQNLFQEKQFAVEELNKVKITTESSIQEKEDLTRRLTEVENKYSRLKSALRVVRDRRHARQGEVRSRSSEGVLESDGDLLLTDGEKPPSSVSALEKEVQEEERRRRPVQERRVQEPVGEKRATREEEKPGRAFLAADKLVNLIKTELRKIPRDPRTEGLKNLVKLFDRGQTDVTAAEVARTIYRRDHADRREAWASPDNGLASSLSSGCDASSSSVLSTSASSATSSPASTSASNVSSCPSSPVLNRRKARGGGSGAPLDFGDRRRFLSGSSGVCSYDSRGRHGYEPEEPYVWYDGVRLSPETGQLVARADKLSREFALRSPQADNPFGAVAPAVVDRDLHARARRMPFYQQPSSSIFATAPRIVAGAAGVTSGSSSDLGRRIAEHQAWLDRFTARRRTSETQD